MDPFRKYIITQIIKQTGKIPRADTVLSNAVAQLKIRIKNMGVDISKITSPKEVQKFLNIQQAWLNQQIKQKAKNIGLMDPNKNIFMKKGPFEGFKPKIVQKPKDIKSKLEGMNKKTIERIKRRRLEAAQKAEREKMAKDPDYLPDIIDPDDFLAYGGVAGLLGERTGFPKGKRVRKQPKKPKPSMTIEEAIEDINKKLKDPNITDEESRRLRITLHDLILGPGMGGPRGDKIYQSKEDLPEGVLEMLQKDPAFDLEKFFETEWAPKGLRWTDPNHPDYGYRGTAGPFGVWSGMAPFGETEMYEFGEKSRGPHDPSVMLTDLDKAKIINHELRHNLMGDPGTPLHHTQPEWVKEYEGPNYLRDKHGESIGTSGHELYNRFIDSRLFPGEKHPGPNAPYFDKILRDHWEPNFQQYKKAVKELKSKPEHLSAEGGRIGLGTGGPPISQGGLTKTVPPKRGPMPQGLPSALYNGIMRPRSY